MEKRSLISSKQIPIIKKHPANSESLFLDFQYNLSEKFPELSNNFQMEISPSFVNLFGRFKSLNSSTQNVDDHSDAQK